MSSNGKQCKFAPSLILALERLAGRIGPRALGALVLQRAKRGVVEHGHWPTNACCTRAAEGKTSRCRARANRARHIAIQHKSEKLLPTTRVSSRCTTHERQAATQHNMDNPDHNIRAASRDSTYERQAGAQHTGKPLHNKRARRFYQRQEYQADAQHMSGKPLLNTIWTIQSTTYERPAATPHTKGKPMHNTRASR